MDANGVKTLKIMILRPDADASSYQIGSFRFVYSILEALRKKVEIKEVWVVEKGGNIGKTYVNSVDSYNVFSFKNGKELVENLKPDIFLGYSSYEFLSRSLLKACTAKKIPTALLIGGILWLSSKENTLSKNMPGRLYQLKTKGGHIIKKYLFLIKTLISLRYGFFFIVKSILQDAYYPLKYKFPEYKLGGANLNICSNYNWVQELVKDDFDKNNLVVVGEGAVDYLYQRTSNLKKPTKENGKIEILFITAGLVEHGFWKPTMREELVTKVVKSIKDEVGEITNLRIKIHPTTEKLEDYRKIVDKIDPSIEILQKVDLIDLINQSDIIVTFGQSAALSEAILLKKPIFIMNLFNDGIENYALLQERIALECKSTDVLVSKIKDGSYINMTTHGIEKFIEKYFYKFDGKCGERAADLILSLLTDGTN